MFGPLLTKNYGHRPRCVDMGILAPWCQEIYVVNGPQAAAAAVAVAATEHPSLVDHPQATCSSTNTTIFLLLLESIHYKKHIIFRHY